MGKPLFFDDAEVRAALEPGALIDEMERALVAFSRGQAQQPVRGLIEVGGGAGRFASMPAEFGGLVGAKLITLFPGNAGRLPTHHALVGVFETREGRALAFMEAEALTELRTAAVSAVAARKLARADARVLGVFGSGVQARSHIAFVRRVRKIDRVLIWSRNVDHAAALAAEIGGEVGTAEAVARAADIVVTATASDEPVLRGKWLRPGTLVLAVGAVGRSRRELDDACMRHPVVVDSFAAAEAEGGDLLLAGVRAVAELGEVLAGAPVPDGACLVFKSHGLAVEDIAAAGLVLRRHGTNVAP